MQAVGIGNTTRPMGAAGLMLLASLCLSSGAKGGNIYAYVPHAVELSRAYQYARMSSGLCLAELRERNVAVKRIGRARGIATPLRLVGRVRGVRFVQTWRKHPNPVGPASILDCALALAVDDLAGVLARHGVVEAEYMSMWRPGRGKPGVRHPAGRAMDLAAVRLKNGRRYAVHQHFFGRIGAQTCGAGAQRPRRKHPGAVFWRRMACELDALRSFNLILSPNYDKGHWDHFHLEVRSGIRWYLTQ